MSYLLMNSSINLTGRKHSHRVLDAGLGLSTNCIRV
jgi:hypothetical protein